MHEGQKSSNLLENAEIYATITIVCMGIVKREN